MHDRLRKALALLAVPVLAAALSGTEAAADSGRLLVEQARDGRFFSINGVDFQARQVCRRVQTGDEVVFLTGSSDGRCTMATFLDLNSGEKCEVWCSQPLREMP